MQSEEICMSCLRIVTARQEALLCDGCTRWQHRLCGTGMSRTTYRHLVKGSVDLPHWRCTECLDASMAIEEPMEAENDRQIALHVYTPPPPLRHAPVASVTPTAPLANSSVGYFQLGFSFGGNNTATETTGLSHVILESTRLSDGPGEATTFLDASVDDSQDGVSDALQSSLCLSPRPQPNHCRPWWPTSGRRGLEVVFGLLPAGRCLGRACGPTTT